MSCVFPTIKLSIRLNVLLPIAARPIRIRESEVARMSLGDLPEENGEDIQTGAISDPTVGQVAAHAGVFGVEPSYLLDRGEPVFDGELVEALRDKMIREAARQISRLPEREQRLVLGIVRQFGDSDAPIFRLLRASTSF
jgi:hypothetical protein